jgi:hypothetical protein
VVRVETAIDFRDSGYVNTAKTHRYHVRFVRDIGSVHFGDRFGVVFSQICRGRNAPYRERTLQLALGSR